MAGAVDNPQPSPFRNLADIDPGRMAFSVLVPWTSVNPSRVAQLVPTVTTYRQFSEIPGFDRSRVEEPIDDPPQEGRILGDCYVYTHHEPAGNLHAFYFVQKRSDAEIGTPIAGLSYYTSDSFYWHEVVERLKFVASRTEFDEYIVNGTRRLVPRIKTRMRLLEGGNFATLFQVDIFASHKPFPLEFFQLDIPVPSTVFWDIRNAQGNRHCLHPYIEIPESDADGEVYPGGTVREPDNLSLGEPMIFPATNHSGRRTHVCAENVVQQQGLWLGERRTAFVPRGHKKLKNVAA